MIHLDNMVLFLFAGGLILFILGVIIVLISFITSRGAPYRSFVLSMSGIMCMVITLVINLSVEGIMNRNRDLFENSYGVSVQNATVVDAGDKDEFDTLIGVAAHGTYKIKTDKGQHAGKTLDVIIDKDGGVKVVDHATGRAVTPKTGKGGE